MEDRQIWEMNKCLKIVTELLCEAKRSQVTFEADIKEFILFENETN